MFLIRYCKYSSNFLEENYRTRSPHDKTLTKVHRRKETQKTRKNRYDVFEQKTFL